MSSSPSRRNKRSDFFAVRRDALVFVTGLAVLCVASVAAGDALPPIHKPHAKTSSASAAAAGSTAPPVAAVPIDHVAHPWRTGQTQLGIDVYWAEKSAESDATVQEKIRKTVNYAVGLGANWISVSFPFVTGGVHSDQLSASPAMTPSLARLRMFIEAAQSAGLKVALRPVLDETALQAQDPNAWRGSIEPADYSAWFASYQTFLVPYLKLAQQTAVGGFYVSTELSSMEGLTSDWSNLIANLKGLYTGPLYASANYDRFAATDPAIPSTERAVDAYFPMKDLGDDASVSELVDGWNEWLDQYAEGALPAVTFSEVGIMPEDGAYASPFNFHASGTVNMQIRVNWYKAACEVAQQRHVAGLYWWYLNLEDADEPADTPTKADPMSFLDTPGAAVVKSCFAELAS